MAEEGQFPGVDDAWEAFVGVKGYGDMTPALLRALREAFYAGAAVFYAYMELAGEMKGTGMDAEAEKFIGALRRELAKGGEGHGGAG